MNAPTAAGRRFRLEPLESRNVPAGVLWQSGLLDGMIALGATFGAERSQPRRSRRIAGRRQDHLAMPAWADVFLDQLQRELEQTELAAGHDVHATCPEQPSRLDELMAKVDRQLELRTSQEENPVTEDAMPGWAEEFLGQIHRDLDRTSSAEASAVSPSDQTTVEFKEPMPEWAEDLLSEVREEVAHWCAR